MDIIPSLRSQNEILAYLKQQMRDTTGTTRWQPVEYYNTLNNAVRRWGKRVTIPFMVDLSTVFTPGVFEYSIPWYVQGPMELQHQITLNQYQDGTPIYISDTVLNTWVDVPGWHLEPDGAGGQKIRLDSEPWPFNARIIWWATNGPVPTVAPTLSAGIDSDDTSLTIASKPVIGASGYVCIDQEWIAYAGYTVDSATTITLTNLLRGLNGTTATSHTSSTSVYWGLGVLREDLWSQLEQQCLANLHGLFLTNAAPQETQNHIFQVRYYEQLAEEFWRSYVPPKAPKLLLGRRGIVRDGR